MKMAAGLDTGDILTQATTRIRPEDNSETLHDRLARMGAELLVRTIPDYVAGNLNPRPQPAEGATYASKIKKQDGHLDWSLPALTLWNRVRGLMPWPGAFSYLPGQPQPHLLKIWQAEVMECAGQPGEVLQADKTGIVVGCGHKALRILILQREGGRRLPAQDFLAGHPLRPGQKLG
jgi:methionyl-tRNA formyltransferase